MHNILIGWNTRPSLQNNVTLDSPSTYCAGATARNNIITTYGWTINDGGESCVQVSTQAVSSISSDSAIGNGTVSSIGDSNPERFIEWGTSSGNYTHECSAGIGGTGPYTCTMSLDQKWYLQHFLKQHNQIKHKSKQEESQNGLGIYGLRIRTEGIGCLHSTIFKKISTLCQRLLILDLHDIVKTGNFYENSVYRVLKKIIYTKDYGKRLL
ncbi:MAG: hypothetical protein CR972_01535 [Candidatus Moraniibacteriota bacterium]|nr:MAG: hypothetical protein CR972_01535 [Candidatus Moranbacteria bacterium]